MGVMVTPTTFKIIISSLDHGVDCILSKLMDDIKMKSVRQPGEMG